MNRLQWLSIKSLFLSVNLYIVLFALPVAASSANDPLNTLPGYTALAFALALSVIPLIRLRRRRAERNRMLNNQISHEK
ncbi:MAG: hypothetical protein ACFFDI_17520 [Promethearchaeota archaeon]